MDDQRVRSMFDQTRVDVLHGWSSYVTGDGATSIRVDFAIGDGVYMVAAKRSDGLALVVRPKHVAASRDGISWKSKSISTGDAFDYWKTRPALATGTSAAKSIFVDGLENLRGQLAGDDDYIKDVMNEVRISIQNFGLALTIIPDLCWLSLYYPILDLGTIELEEVRGRVCFRDIAIAREKLGFKVELNATADNVRTKLGNGTLVECKRVGPDPVQLDLRVGVFLDVSRQRVDLDVTHVKLQGPEGNLVSGSTDPLSLKFTEGLDLLIERVSANYTWGTPDPLHRATGFARLKSPRTEGTKNVFELGAGSLITPHQGQPFILFDLVADLDLDSSERYARDRHLVTSTVSSLDLKADWTAPGLKINAFDGSFLNIQAHFGPHHRDLGFSINNAKFSNGTEFDLDQSRKLLAEGGTLDASVEWNNALLGVGDEESRFHADFLQIRANKGSVTTTQPSRIAPNFPDGFVLTSRELISYRAQTGGVTQPTRASGLADLSSPITELVNAVIPLGPDPKAEYMEFRTLNLTELALSLVWNAGGSGDDSLHGTFRADIAGFDADYSTDNLTLKKLSIPSGGNRMCRLESGVFGSGYDGLEFQLISVTVDEAVSRGDDGSVITLKTMGMEASGRFERLHDLSSGLPRVFSKVHVVLGQISCSGEADLVAEGVNVDDPANPLFHLNFQGIVASIQDLVSTSGGSGGSRPNTVGSIAFFIESANTTDTTPIGSIRIAESDTGVWLTEGSVQQLAHRLPQGVLDTVKESTLCKWFEDADALEAYLKSILSPQEFSAHGALILSVALQDAQMTLTRKSINDLAGTVPQPLLSKLEDDGLDVWKPRHCPEGMEAWLRAIMTPAEFNSYGNLALQKARTDTLLRDVHLQLEKVLLDASLQLDSAGKAIWRGNLSISKARFGFVRAEGLMLEDVHTIRGVGPLAAADRYELLDVMLALPSNRMTQYAGGATQKFDSADIRVPGIPLRIPGDEPVAGGVNRARASLMPVAPSKNAVAYQVRVPAATMDLPDVQLNLKDLRLDWYDQKFSPDLSGHLRAYDLQRLMRFSLIIKLFTHKAFSGDTYDIDGCDAVMGVIRWLAEIAKINISPQVLSAGDRLCRIGYNAIVPASILTKPLLEVKEFGVYIKTKDTTATLDPHESDDTHIAIRVNGGFHEIGVYSKVKWLMTKEGRYTQHILKHNVSMTVTAIFGYEFDSVAHRIRIKDPMLVFHIATGPIRKFFDGVQKTVLWKILPLSAIQKILEDELNQRLPRWPDDLDVSNVKISFDPHSNEVSIYTEATFRKWQNLD